MEIVLQNFSVIRYCERLSILSRRNWGLRWFCYFMILSLWSGELLSRKQYLWFCLFVLSAVDLVCLSLNFSLQSERISLFVRLQ